MAHAHLRHNERGMALIEMAIVVTLLVLLTFGVMEYGWMFFRMHQVSTVAREGAREAVLPDTTHADVVGKVDGLMSGFGMSATGYTVEIFPADIEGVNVGDVITVAIAVPYSAVELLGMPTFFPTPASLRSRVAMAKEGP